MATTRMAPITVCCLQTAVQASMPRIVPELAREPVLRVLEMTYRTTVLQFAQQVFMAMLICVETHAILHRRMPQMCGTYVSRLVPLEATPQGYSAYLAVHHQISLMKLLTAVCRNAQL